MNTFNLRIIACDRVFYDGEATNISYDDEVPTISFDVPNEFDSDIQSNIEGHNPTTFNITK